MSSEKGMNDENCPIRASRNRRLRRVARGKDPSGGGGAVRRFFRNGGVPAGGRGSPARPSGSQQADRHRAQLPGTRQGAGKTPAGGTVDVYGVPHRRRRPRRGDPPAQSGGSNRS